MLDVISLPPILTGTLGAICGFGLNIAYAAWSNRFGLQAYIVRQERLYIRVVQSRDTPCCEAADPGDPDTSLVLTFVVCVQNLSSRGDGIRAASLRLPCCNEPPPAQTRLDEDFYGLNVPAHSLAYTKLRFSLKRSVFANHPIWDQQQELDFELMLLSLRDKKVALPLIQNTHVHVSHKKGDRITWLGGPCK